ncbi:glutathione S-transferase family protein [Caulobacter sp. 17J65-9]|uniref:glutathione S-transferase family protein n=1 Tax=Caulobacter sp. 17J65-9 TaxID=2709382 RepID=UPI0013C79C49|nr:glutathione S-transferase family protein [Caulobacter sp. 17J65-9]NEX94289.1 glutathione S-transferase family protein [Caulobacter sp. 17J65-9]
MELVIGDKNLSSWSLRPWLVLKRTGAPFIETLVRLNRDDTPAQIQKHSPSGMIPALKVDGEVIWDSMAICVYLAETFPQVQMWPKDPIARALARSAACEMHAGFASLRGECPMDLSKRVKIDVSQATAVNLRRLSALWGGMRARFGQGGPFLFGEWSIADAFYTPVATRIRTYGLVMSDYGDAGAAGAYVETLLEQPEFLEWERAALEDAKAA